MTEPDDTLRRLIALKRYEQPPEEFVDDFLAKFHQRQRADLMKLSLRELLMERIEGFFERISPPQLALATVAVVLMLTGVFSSLPDGAAQPGIASVAPRPDHHQPVVLNSDLPPPDILNKSANFGNNLPPEEAARLSPLLLSKHFVGGYADEAREMVAGEFVSSHSSGFDVMPMFSIGEEDTTRSAKAEGDAPKN